jgi:biopolymer transport protein ExbB/TolQ
MFCFGKKGSFVLFDEVGPSVSHFSLFRHRFSFFLLQSFYSSRQLMQEVNQLSTLFRTQQELSTSSFLLQTQLQRADEIISILESLLKQQSHSKGSSSGAMEEEKKEEGQWSA